MTVIARTAVCIHPVIFMLMSYFAVYPEAR